MRDSFTTDTLSFLVYYKENRVDSTQGNRVHSTQENRVHSRQKNSDRFNPWKSGESAQKIGLIEPMKIGLNRGKSVWFNSGKSVWFNPEKSGWANSKFSGDKGSRYTHMRNGITSFQSYRKTVLVGWHSFKSTLSVPIVRFPVLIYQSTR